MDPLLTICLRYYQEEGCFLNHSIRYNQGCQMIDICALDLKNGHIYDVLIKPYHDTRMYQNKVDTVCRTLLDIKRDLKIKSFLDVSFYQQFHIKKVLITTKFDQKWVQAFYEKGIEVIFIDDLIAKLSQIAKCKDDHHDSIMYALHYQR